MLVFFLNSFIFCVKYYFALFNIVISNLYIFCFLLLDLLKKLSWMKPDILIKHIDVNVFSHKHFAQNLMDYLSDNLSQITLHNNNTE